MANILVTVPDAVVPRIRAAFGREGTDGVRVAATLAELQAAIKGFLIERVLFYEPEVSARTTRDAVTTEAAAW